MEKYETYIKKLREDITKLAYLKYLLIYEKNKVLHYSEGSDVILIANQYNVDSLSPEEALEMALDSVEATNGAIYELINDEYKLLVRWEKMGSKYISTELKN